MSETNSSTLTVPIGQAVQVLQVLQTLAAHKPEGVTTGVYRYPMARVINRLVANPDLMAADKVRVEAVQKYGQAPPCPQCGGDELKKKECPACHGSGTVNGALFVPSDKAAEFLAEWQPIAVKAITLDVPRIPARLLQYAPDISVADMMALEPFLEGE
jgi:hypothetical protein